MMGRSMIGAWLEVQQAGGLPALLRTLAVAGIGLGGTACSSLENLQPDWSQFRLPDSKTFVPTTVSAYSGPVTKTDPVGPADLVDAQGLCVGMAAPSSSDAPAAQSPDVPVQRGVTLEMSECEVVRAMGRPQSAEIGNEPSGVRTAALNFTTGERAGIYRFRAGRLVSIERGAEPPPQPAVAKKQPAKPIKKPAPPA